MAFSKKKIAFLKVEQMRLCVQERNQRGQGLSRNHLLKKITRRVCSDGKWAEYFANSRFITIVHGQTLMRLLWDTDTTESVTVSAIATLGKPVQDLQERDCHIMQKTWDVDDVLAALERLD